ncbi:MAG: YbhN family protein [Deltaproteobacteria bacterium]|nr:YbhN family protein [Deltaproteobacteria bacterium]
MSRALSPLARKRLGQALVGIVALLFAALAIRMLRHELRPEVWARMPAAIEALPLWRIIGAVVVAVGVYTWLGCFDRLGFLVVRQPISTPFAMRTGFMAYAIVHNLGLALFTGTAFRAHRYRARGISAGTIARIWGSNVVTMWTGFLLACGTALLWRPPGVLHGVVLERLIGAALIAVVVAYVVAAFIGVRPLRVKSFSIAVPQPTFAIAQTLTGAVHWSLSALVLTLVLPDNPFFVDVLAALCMAQVVAAASHIPGGVGVLEGMLLLLLGGEGGLDRTGVIAGVLLFRAVYFLFPFALTIVGYAVGRVVVIVTGLSQARAGRGTRRAARV